METTKTRTRNRRGEGARLRQEIVAAAADLLDSGGESAVTLKDIARMVGISSPSIYAHFPDREAIVAAVVAGTFGELKAELISARDEAGSDPVARLQALCAAYPVPVTRSGRCHQYTPTTATTTSSTTPRRTRLNVRTGGG